MKSLIFLFLLTSCASIKEASMFPGFKESSNTTSVDSESKHFENNSGQHLFYSVVMKDLNPAEAGRLFQNRKNYVKSLYQNDRDPYFSKTSRSDECLKGLNLEGQSLSFKQSQSISFNLPSTDNFVLGQCNPVLETFSSTIYFIYCGQKKSFYELKYFRPKDSPALFKFELERFCEN